MQGSINDSLQDQAQDDQDLDHAQDDAGNMIELENLHPPHQPDTDSALAVQA